MPARGPEPISARSLAILVSETATTFSAPDSSTSASRLPCASNGSSGASISRPDLLRQLRAHALGELGVGVQAGAGGGAAERDLGDLRQRVAHALGAEPDLRGVAGELLAERHGHGVHQVRAAGLDDVLELVGLGGERRLELLQRGQQLVRRLGQRGEVHRGGEDVVGRLAHVHVVVGWAPSPARLAITSLAFMFDEVPEPVWKTSTGNWSSCSPRADRLAGRADALGEVGVEQAELAVDAGGRAP